MGIFAQVAAEVAAAVRKNNPSFVVVAAEVQNAVERRLKIAATNKDQEWQRVHSYIADVLKDTHVLYAKLARLEGDFTGVEREQLEGISEKVLGLGEELSAFSKEFYQGKFSMQEKGFSYGEPSGLAPGGAPPPIPGEGEGEEELSEEAPPEPEGAAIPVVIEGEEEEEK